MQNILFVCTGNTCRSVMGAAWLENFLKTKHPNVLANIDSAGIYAADGMKASEGAIRRMRQENVDLSWHRSKGLSRSMIESADIIFCMSYSHARHILEMSPKVKDKVVVLNVEDPIGLGERVYDVCLEEIITGIQAHIGRILEG